MSATLTYLDGSLESLLGAIEAYNPLDFKLHFEQKGLGRGKGWIASWRIGTSFADSDHGNTRPCATPRAAIESAIAHMQLTHGERLAGSDSLS